MAYEAIWVKNYGQEVTVKANHEELEPDMEFLCSGRIISTGGPCRCKMRLTNHEDREDRYFYSAERGSGATHGRHKDGCEYSTISPYRTVQFCDRSGAGMTDEDLFNIGFRRPRPSTLDGDKFEEPEDDEEKEKHPASVSERPPKRGSTRPTSIKKLYLSEQYHTGG